MLHLRRLTHPLDGELESGPGRHAEVIGLLVVLVVVGACVYAVAKSDAGPRAASVHIVSATGSASVPNGLGGDAVLTASELNPGARAGGTVTVENGGDATGAFQLSQTDVLDTPGAGGGRLSTALRLRLDDARTGSVVYRGLLGKMNPEAIGYLRPGEKRSYRFTLAPPAEATGDDRYAGSRVQTTFKWTATTREPPRPDTTPPAFVVQVVRPQPEGGGTVLLALTCDERCIVAGVSRGARVQGAQRLLPGRPTLQAVELSSGDARTVARRLQRQGSATLRLDVTVADPAGNRTTRRVAVRVVR